MLIRSRLVCLRSLERKAFGTTLKPTIVDNFSQFLNRSPDPYHCVQQLKHSLLAKSFTELNELNSWKQSIKLGGNYFIIRNQTSIIAFTVGNAFCCKEGSIALIGAHTDSPNLRLKPYSKWTSNKANMEQLRVCCYGGGLWHTWLDRDLSISGSVLLKHKDDKGSKHYTEIVNLGQNVKNPQYSTGNALLRIPSLAIHLQTMDEKNSKYASSITNKEEHLVPIMRSIGTAEEANNIEVNGSKWLSEQSSSLLKLLVSHLNAMHNREKPIEVTDIVDFDLHLYDTQPAAIIGAPNAVSGEGDFLTSARLDNLTSCYLAMEALMHSQHEARINMVALFDHEEVGSKSIVGANSVMTRNITYRIMEALYSNQCSMDTAAATTVSMNDCYEMMMRRSLGISMDMAHGTHPNYTSRHESSHAPVLNGGIVIKENVNQNYATTKDGALHIRQLCDSASIPYQQFVVRNDCSCGSTIGPSMAANTGIEVVDIGLAQLSMHSIREVMGVKDVAYGYKLLHAFFSNNL